MGVVLGLTQQVREKIKNAKAARSEALGCMRSNPERGMSFARLAVRKTEEALALSRAAGIDLEERTPVPPMESEDGA